MRRVAGRAAQAIGRLMQVCLLELVGLIAVAGQASIHRIGLQKARRLACVWIVAGNAISLRSRMRHLGFVYLLRLIAVAGDAQCLRIGLRQDNLAVLRGLMAALAGTHREWRMCESLQQLGRARLVGVMTLHTVGTAERLPLVRLLQAGVLGIVAIDA